MSLSLAISIISGTISLLSLSLAVYLYRRFRTQKNAKEEAFYYIEETPGGTQSELNIEESSAVHVDLSDDAEYWREVADKRAI